MYREYLRDARRELEEAGQQTIFQEAPRVHPDDVTVIDDSEEISK